MESIVASSEANDSNHTNSDISGSVSVVQVIPGQTVQVHRIPASLVTAASLQPAIKAFQVINSDVDNTASADEDSESKKRRELLARRPSYRRILNDLSSTDNPTTITVAKIEEESDDNSSDSHDDVTGTLTNSVGGVPIQAASLIQPGSLKVVPAQTIQIAAHGDSPSPGLQTLTMTNASGANIISPTGGATIVQYAQAADGQFLIPVSTIGGSSIQYQIAGTTASLPQGVVMTSGSGLPAAQVSEEASRKRELRLLKNREAARECRRKKKEYVKCLENRVAVLENQNKTLIEELKSLKELYCQKEGQS